MSKAKLKTNLISTRGYSCETCGISEWLDKPITLEMDHIDGNNQNDDLSNLRLLCPNCHSQTKTWRGRNKTSKITSDDSLIQALRENDTICQALKSLGMAPKGANYKRAGRLLNHTYEASVQTSNSQYGTVWIHKIETNKKIKAEELDDYIDLGWTKGRYLKDYTPPNQKGKFWITNGLSNKMIDREQPVPNGWWKGRFQ